MPLSKEKMKERKQADRNVKPMSNLNEVPNEVPEPADVKPKHCNLKHCVICDPEYYQEYFKRTYGDYDWPNMSDDLKVRLSQT